MPYTQGSLSLLSNVAATGVAFSWGGGRGVFVVPVATFGGATVSLQWSPDGGTTWMAVDKSGDTFTTFTAAGSGGFELPPCLIRGLIAGGPPSGVYAYAMPVNG